MYKFVMPINYSDDEDFNENSRHCPINISQFPNNMGINLCSVKDVEWVRQKDGQLVTITINFKPADELEFNPDDPESEQRHIDKVKRELDLYGVTEGDLK